MIIGVDYWNTISSFPDFFRRFATDALSAGNEIHVVSAIGKKRAGTIQAEIETLGVPFTAVHEVFFNRKISTPELKLAKCRELGIELFFDDRNDICQLLRENGITSIIVNTGFPEWSEKFLSLRS